MSDQGHIVMVLDNPFISDMRVRKEATSLVNAGFKVTMVCTSEDSRPSEEVQHGIHIKRLLDQRIFHPTRSGFKDYVNDIATKILELEPQIVHCHDFNTLEFGAKVKEINPAVFLTYDSHEYFRKWLVYQDIEGFWNRIKGYFVWRHLIKQEARNIKLCNAVISTADEMCRVLKADNKLSIDPITVRNIPDIKPDPNYGETIRSILGIHENELIMVQSGNMYQDDREFDIMVKEALEIDGLHFVFIGNRPRHRELEDRIKSQNLGERTHFIEYDEKRLFNLLQSADFGVLFMKTDKWVSHLITCPNRIMEYSMVGIPFLSVEQMTSRQLSESFDNVDFFDVNKKGSFKKSIQEMISKLEHRTAGARKIAPTFDWEKEFKIVVKLYKSITKNS